MRSLRILIVGLVMTGLAAPAIADEDLEEEDDFARPGIYLSASGVYVIESWKNSLEDAGAQDTQGINARFGARVNQWASIEIELELIDNFSPTDTETYGMISTSINTRVYPVGGRFQPFGLGGLGVIATIVKDRGPDSTVPGNHADWAIRAGGGIDLYFTPKAGVTFEGVYVFTIGSIKDNDHASLGAGVFYRF
jgi:hypothetical protein